MSPNTARGLLGIFPLGADPPATDQRATTPPIRLQSSLSLRAILAAGARGRGAQGGVSGHRIPRDGGGGKRRIRREEWERRREDERQVRGEDKDDVNGIKYGDNGPDEQVMGPQGSGKQRRSRGGGTAQGERPRERAQSKAPDKVVTNLTAWRPMKG